jgi:hypothetical protein
VNSDRIAATLRRPAVLALIWLAALWRFISAFLALPSLAHRLDFANYYDSALALRSGLDPYTANLTSIGNRVGFETGPLIHASETPAFLLCFETLTRFTPATAFSIWITLNLVALAIAVVLLVCRPGLDARTGWLLGALILAFYPIGWNFFWAQSQVLTLALMVAAMRALEDERDATAGTWVAIAGLLRATPFLLVVYFALRRNWRAVKFAVCGVAAGALLTVAILGFWQCLSFLNGAKYVADRDRMIFPFVISIAPFVSRMFWALFGDSQAPAADWVRHAAIIGVDAIVLAATVRATLASVGRRDEDCRVYSLWIVTSLLVSPIAWHHYLTLLVIPFMQIAIAAAGNRASRRAIWMACASYLLACVSVPITFRLLAHPTAFQRAFPSLSAPLLETGFFTLLMGYLAAYWFTVDFTDDVAAAEPQDLVQDKLRATGA